MELGYLRIRPAFHSASTSAGIGGGVDCKLVKGDASLGDTALLLEAAVSLGSAVFKGASSIITGLWTRIII